MDTRKKILALINGAEILGLKQSDLDIATDFFQNNEYGLCFDTIVTQMYEYDIDIDSRFYSLVSKIGISLNIQTENYSFLESLVIDQDKIQKHIRDRLTLVLGKSFK